jgi:capsule synthesis protein PGA_cap
MHGRGPNPAPRRRRPTPAVYQRRPLGVLAVVVAVVVVTAFAIRDGGGGPSSVREIVRAQREAQPVRFTIESSGDLLIHMAVWTRALALGGSDYDFAPLFDAIKPYVAGADLALCHVETPMTPAPPASYPVFNTPPELARGISATGWDACDTAGSIRPARRSTGSASSTRAPFRRPRRAASR